ncbi:hypothetical protein [Phenylobacterium sp. SCN 70-31]|uniref:hypothetical protein n=1 Tax=Phenylobacterium sp. SCN 70-31 TaxID=1660129 RepID=UPI00086D0F92|nr:hypothetical protein [Phenylobacterium sp. SCN 70-31]ODT84838.1 MAG: hypothetical protein ABS78_22030 [Phenylobacterium sp. SCN 70-31]
MARIAPELLIKDDRYNVVAGEGVFAVVYDGRVINLVDTAFNQRKYLRTLFANPGLAKTLASRLNRQFETDRFTVAEFASVAEVRRLGENGPEVVVPLRRVGK